MTTRTMHWYQLHSFRGGKHHAYCGTFMRSGRIDITHNESNVTCSKCRSRMGLPVKTQDRQLRDTRLPQSEVIDPELAVMAPGDIAARLDALNRIMAAWKVYEEQPNGGHVDALREILKHVAREFGLGGEDGGSK